MSVIMQLKGITYSGSKYSNEQRTHAALVYLTYGNLNKTSRAVNIPQRTLEDWTKTEWWRELTTKLREEKKDEFDAGFTRIIDKTIKTIENQLDSGEVKARDAATIMGITFDKRQVLNNQPTSITGKSQDISKLQAQFEEYLQAKEIDVEVLQKD